MGIIKTFESFKSIIENNPCWDGYKQIGTKMKNGKRVPNCVPVKESDDASEGDSNREDTQKFSDQNLSDRFPSYE
jgi:hypothetical protein